MISPLLLMMSMASPLAAQQPKSIDIYVHPDGNPMADARSPARAVNTLERARDIARRLPAPRTIHISGRFILKHPLELASIDSSTNWIGTPGATLLGNNYLPLAIHGTNLRNVTFGDFTISNFTQQGIKLVHAAHVTITGLTISHITSTAWSQSGIDISGNTTDVKIIGNTVFDTGYNGISVFSDYNQNEFRITITRNHVSNTCRSVADCGAIYIGGRGNSQGSVISDNVINGFGPPSSKGRGIYLDDFESNVTVTRNCIIGPGMYGMQIHGGRMNKISKNYIDVRQLKAALLNQATDQQPTRIMDGNVFTENTIYTHPNNERLVDERQFKSNQLANVVKNQLITSNPSNLCPQP